MKKGAKVRAVVYGILIALVLFEGFGIIGGYDYVKASLYQPTTEIENVIHNLDLTTRGERIFKASNPNLDTREIFNEKCNSHNVEVYVLGCYLTGDDTIHLYNVEEKELRGVVESTAAHELLHAVYNRLPFWEKDSLNKKLQAVYDSLDDSSDIKTSMELYSSDDFYDELHSRLGTQVKDLPEELEKHYAAIFSDQDKVVVYYNNYSGTFKKYETELKNLETRITNLRKEIDEEQSTLAVVASNLNSKVEDYNNRVRTKNYTSVEAIRAEGGKLQTEIDNLNSAYDTLNKKISDYNNLIDEYNSNVIHTNQIFDSINSNSSNLNSVNN